ncbi:MAG: hypothetical protein ACPG7F_10840 [Aggregatilineales bacterium]
MALRQLTITLPEDLAEEADDFDLLTSETFTALLRQVVDDAVMKMVNEEIQDYRREKRDYSSES